MRMRGFTLLELLVTMAVVVILASIAVPSYQKMRDRDQLSADINTILVGLNYARVEAVKRGQEDARVELYIVADGTEWIYEVRPAGGGSPMQERRASGNRVALSASENPVTFNFLGRAATSCADDCRIELSGANACRAIRVNRLGDIRQEECGN